MADTYLDPIQRIVVGSNAATVTFSSIPQTYTDLLIKVSARSDRGGGISIDELNMYFNNNNSTSLYSWTHIGANGSTANSTRIASYNASQVTGSTTAYSEAGMFGVADIYIPNYTSSGFKQILTTFVAEANIATFPHSNIRIGASLYRGTTAITSITWAPQGSNIVPNSTFTLYGVETT